MEDKVSSYDVVWDADSKTGVFKIITSEIGELKVNNAAELTAVLLLLSRSDAKWDNKAKKLYTGSKPAEW